MKNGMIRKHTKQDQDGEREGGGEKGREGGEKGRKGGERGERERKKKEREKKLYEFSGINF